MYFQLVESQVLSTQGQLDVFNLHRLPYPGGAVLGERDTELGSHVVRGVHAR